MNVLICLLQRAKFEPLKNAIFEIRLQLYKPSQSSYAVKFSSSLFRSTRVVFTINCLSTVSIYLIISCSTYSDHIPNILPNNLQFSYKTTERYSGHECIIYWAVAKPVRHLVMQMQIFQCL